MSQKKGWDPLAKWYDGWMGQEGSKHHQLVIPTVIELLNLQPNDKLIDLGCGQGVLSTYVNEQQAHYTGLDISPTLIEIAEKRHSQQELAQFFQADVTDLEVQVEKYQLPLKESSFDKATFLLSIADIENLDQALHSAAWALKPQGTLVILMIHPAFRIPRQSGWGYDPQRKLQYRRIDSYLTPNAIPLKPYPGQKGVSKSYHRPIQTYMQALKNNDFKVSDLREITVESLLPQNISKKEKRAVQEFPLFMAWQAIWQR